jgi:hypothetical protein
MEERRAEGSGGESWSLALLHVPACGCFAGKAMPYMLRQGGRSALAWLLSVIGCSACWLRQDSNGSN